MSRKKSKTRKNREPDSEKAGTWLWSLEPEARLRLRRGVLWTMATCVLAVAIWATLGAMERKVHAHDRYDRSLTLKWVGLPDWLELEDNRHILDGLTRCAGLTTADRPLDAGLAERIGRALSQPHIGWIKATDSITVRPDGVVSVQCRFRRPSAWVRHGEYCYLVDDEGTRLPGRYNTAECRQSVLLMVEGVRNGPPDVGRAWRGGDLSSGLRLVALLKDRPFRKQVTSVVVANHDGRLDRSRPHLELATNRKNSRIWWGRSPNEEFGTEITAAQKITLLETLYNQWGRIDMNRAYVNIMTWPDKVSMPVDSRPAKPTVLLRG